MQRTLLLLFKTRSQKVNIALFRGAWTDEEDYLLITLFLKLGRRWSKIAKVIEGRN